MSWKPQGRIMDEAAKILLESGVVEVSFDKPFKFTSGKLSPIYCDNRILLSMPEQREKIISLMAKKASKLSFSLIAGIATASIPWASMLAFKLGMPLIYVRKDAKEYGKGKRIEGVFKKGEKVLLIEDLVSTGGSALDAVSSLREAGLKIENCLAIFTYNIGNAEKKFQECGVKLLTLTNINEVLDTAIMSGKITKEQRQKVIEALK